MRPYILKKMRWNLNNMKKKIKKRFYLDYSILVPYLILSILGIVMVYSASSAKLASAGMNPAKDAIRQAAFFIVGLISVAFIYKMKTSVFQNKRFITFSTLGISGMLVLTKFSNLGVSGGGADGWLRLGPISLQPIEFLKIIIVWYLAYNLSKKQHMIQQDVKTATFKPFIIVSILIILVLIQPDNGGAAILVMMASIMFFASGINYMYTMLAIGGGVIGAFLAIELIVLSKGVIFPGRFQYVYHRFRTFSNPFIDPLGDGHQMINSYYAIKNGGWFGRGIGNSIQKKGFLSAAQTDFMFSIVVEELGLILSLIILGILLYLIVKIFVLGINSRSTFNSLMCIGIGGMLLIQTFINLGGVVGIIPLTGVTFPFLSQGGSSLITLSIGIGMVLNISADEKHKKMERAKKQYYMQRESKQLIESR